VTERRRVVITGRGVLSPLGCDWPSFSEAIRSGRTAPVAPFPGSGEPDPPLLHVLPAGAVELDRRSEPLAEVAIAAAGNALAEAGLASGGKHDGIGLVMNTVLGPSHAIESYLERLAERGPRGSRPAQFVDTLLSMPGSRAGIELGLRGSTAVLGGSSALELAFDWVAYRREDTVVAGGGEWQSPKCLRYLRAAAARSGSQRALLAQASAFVVLEDDGHARERGGAVLAEVLGSGAASEPQTVSLPWSNDEAAAALAASMNAALEDAGVAAREVDAVVLAAGDDLSATAERQAASRLLGEMSPVILAPKRLMGEALAASGPLALLAALACLEAGSVALVNAYEMGGNATTIAVRVGP
jgi:3-oxoacyl-(acyl-carrier-protein) synthase